MVSSPNDSLGLQVRSLSCWEYGSILLPPPDSCEEDFLSGDLVPLGELRVVSAWFGDANDPSLCTEITEEVQRQHAEAASQGRRVEIAATARRWGDPATFRLKQMEITYEHQWLSSDRREVLLTLKARAEEKAQGAEVEALLKRLSAAMLGTVAGEDSLGSTSPRWRQLGFQSNDPRSDLRTGLLALDCLVFMAERYPLANSQMIREAQSTGIDYPFAVASINVTQHLARYLHLVRDAVGCALDIASPRTVHRFAGLLQRQEEPIDVTVPFCELHAAVMTRLHCNWRRRKREDPQITVMSFAPVLEETLKSTRRFCEGALMSSSSEFRSWVDETEVRDGAEPPLSVPSVAFRPEEENQITESLQQTVRQVSETASILGTYLQGVISERWLLQQPKT